MRFGPFHLTSLSLLLHALLLQWGISHAMLRHKFECHAADKACCATDVSMMLSHMLIDLPWQIWHEIGQYV